VDFRDTPMVQVVKVVQDSLNRDDGLPSSVIGIPDGVQGERIRAFRLTIQAKSISLREFIEIVADILKCSTRYRGNEIQLWDPPFCSGPDAYSGRIRTPVPIQSGHPFRRGRTPIPVNPDTAGRKGGVAG